MVQNLSTTIHTIHSYSQLWLWPYGYDYNALPDNWQEIKKLAEDAADALYQVHGTVFDPINSADLCKLHFYHTCAIISQGLYILYPIFHCS